MYLALPLGSLQMALTGESDTEHSLQNITEPTGWNDMLDQVSFVLTLLSILTLILVLTLLLNRDLTLAQSQTLALTLTLTLAPTLTLALTLTLTLTQP
jgi:hypothetical protein